MRKRCLTAVAIAAGLLVGGLVFLTKNRDESIREENFHKIEVGMTLAEVEEIFGLPPGSYYDGPTEFLGDDSVGWVPQSTRWPDSVRWLGRAGRVQAFFDDDNRLTGAYFEKRMPAPEPLFARIQRFARSAAGYRG